ncbi:hypothetical protein KQI84_08580 [bacterium]|nr:hypothetical protein [bacterium]
MKIRPNSFRRVVCLCVTSVVVAVVMFGRITANGVSSDFHFTWRNVTVSDIIGGVVADLRKRDSTTDVVVELPGFGGLGFVHVFTETSHDDTIVYSVISVDAESLEELAQQLEAQMRNFRIAYNKNMDILSFIDPRVADSSDWQLNIAVHKAVSLEEDCNIEPASDYDFPPLDVKLPPVRDFVFRYVESLEGPCHYVAITRGATDRLVMLIDQAPTYVRDPSGTK